MATGADEMATPSWLLCRLGTRLCALPLGHVSETMRIPPVEPLVGTPHFVRGLSIIRGSPVPIVDAALLLGDQDPAAQRLVTLSIRSRVVAIAVGSVLEVRSIGAPSLGALPPLLQGAGEVIATIGRLDDELLFVLNAARLVPEDFFGAAPNRSAQ
jgi:purine-binding chemotaxis protein CheW